MSKGIQGTAKRSRYLFLWGALTGAVCFLAVYGVKVLDFTYADWMFFGEQDLYQHYIGWCHYRATPWQFPVGMIDSLAAPLKVSVVWTDSIPLFAVLFKLFRGVLPKTFQYFGLFGLLSFALQGGLSALILGKYVKNGAVCVLSSVFFILSFPMLHRMFYHTSLGAQWLILLALLIWLEKRRFQSAFRLAAVWAGMAVLTVFIHSYFLPVTGLMMLGMTLDVCLEKGGRKEIKRGLFIALSYVTAGLFSLWALGAFGKGASAFGEGLGTFSSNLNTFYNSQGHGIFRKGLPLFFDWQEEGFGYLGLGMLFLCAVAVILLVRRMARLKRAGAVFHRKDLWEYLKGRRSAVLLFLAAFFLFLYAVSPIVTLNGVELIHVPLPGFAEKLLNIFRSSGRFIWTPMYLMMIGAVYVIHRDCGRRVFASLMGAALVLQLLDIFPYAAQKRDYFAGTTWSYDVMWEDSAVDKNAEKYDAFVFLYTENDILLPTAYYAYYRGMTVNNYYFARSYEDSVREKIEEYKRELEEGKPRENVIYVFRPEDGTPDYPLYYRKMNGHMIGTAKPLSD